MSDRERCGDCIWCAKIPRMPQYSSCTYPVPYWTLPSSMVDPDTLVTCPTYTEIKEEETKSLSN